MEDAPAVESDDSQLRALTPLAVALTMRDEFTVVANMLERLEARISSLATRVSSLEEILVAMRAAISTQLVGPPPP